MKKLLMLLLVIATVSCSNENDLNEMENTISKKFSIEKFTGNVVALKTNNEVKLVVSNEKIINSFNNYSKRIDLGKKAISMEVLNIDDQGYIRFYNEDASVSTVALTSSDNLHKGEGKLVIGLTICTSDMCANSGGCVPSGKYCTVCTKDPQDCKRSTSSAN